MFNRKPRRKKHIPRPARLLQNGAIRGVIRVAPLLTVHRESTNILSLLSDTMGNKSSKQPLDEEAGSDYTDDEEEAEEKVTAEESSSQSKKGKKNKTFKKPGKWAMMKQGYSEMVNAIIRPPRAEYSDSELGVLWVSLSPWYLLVHLRCFAWNALLQGQKLLLLAGKHLREPILR